MATTTEYLLDREVERVLSALMPQNRLIMRMVLRNGMRLSDALEFKTDNLKLAGWYVEKKDGQAPPVRPGCGSSGGYPRTGGAEVGISWTKRPGSQEPSGGVGRREAGGPGVSPAAERGTP